ncbi:MAG: PhoPQ-activated protein PqaA family protein [Fimbriimonas sp.]
MLPFLLALVAVPAPPQELYKYLSKKDSAFAHRVVSEDANGTTIELTSQTWQGSPWRHTVILRQPKKLAKKGTGILYITGDGPRTGDYTQLAFVTEATGMPVAMLFNIPNQPLWDMKEDDLIAHTFQKYLETGDGDWPLLFPMTKAALRAMDAVEATTKGTENPLGKFVVTGASKRGWTTWFVGAAKDPRVLGIAPMVYDNLNVAAQMPHQIQQWGKYSEQIEDYTRRGLQAQLATEKGKKLAAIIDPYTYRSNIRVPTLIVTGANDRYWTADAMSLYWNDLKQPKWAKVVPNVGHDLGGGLEAANTIGAFARSLAGEFKMPKPTWRIKERPGIAEIYVGSDVPYEEARVWTAISPDGDFRPAKWNVAGKLGPTEKYHGIAVSGNASVATFVEFRYRIADRTFSVTTPPKVIKGT